MPIRVGRVPYLEAEPFYFDMARRGIELRETTPRQLGDALANGELDAGPAHITDVFRLENQFEPVGGFCFSALSRAVSACLYSQYPIEELGGVAIGVSDEDVTRRKIARGTAPPKVQPGAGRVCGQVGRRYPPRRDLRCLRTDWQPRPAPSSGAFEGSPTVSTWVRSGPSGPTCPSFSASG